MPHQTQVPPFGAATSTPLNGALSLMGRIAMAALYIPSGIGKLGAPDATISFIASAGLPFAPLGLAIAVIVEIGLSALLLLGLYTRAVAAVMGAFTIATAVFFHSQLGDQMQFVHFFKNIAIAGGFLQVVAFGPGRFSLDARRGASRT